MAKSKNPLFSFDARGTIARALTFRHRGQQTIAESIPTHPDAKSPNQLSWRTMYEACSALWHTLSDAEQAAWESLARRKHMTGFALWQSQCLRPNPGIYLPLAGGTMAGNIDMANHKITGLPDPTADTQAANKAYVDAGGGGGAKITSGYYNGDGTDNLAIPHSLGNIAKFVFIVSTDGDRFFFIVAGLIHIYCIKAGELGVLDILETDDENFYVGNSGNYLDSANDSDTGYNWVAMG